MANETTPEEFFGPAVYTYTRKQALPDGEQVDASETAREAGITFPVYLLRSVWDKYVTVPEGVRLQEEKGRLWDICWMLSSACRSAGNRTEIWFELYVRNNNRKPRLIKLRSKLSTADVDDARPAITVMPPD